MHQLPRKAAVAGFRPTLLSRVNGHALEPATQPWKQQEHTGIDYSRHLSLHAHSSTKDFQSAQNSRAY
eukprot:365303-Chlamydomonas_euryale.AAC.46